MKQGPHIVSAFDDELMAIQAKIAEMGGLAETMLSDALEAIQQRNIEGCEAVVAMDKRMDRLELEVETLITRALALRQPMAADLRLLIAGLKMTTTLERMGDLVKNIAKRGIELARGRPQKLTASIVRMGQETQRQITEVLDAYTSRDTALAVSVWRRDVEIDELYNSIFRELITYMMEDPRLITLGSQYLFIAKNLERIGDHATHIAEMTYHVVEGEPLGDDRPKGTTVGLDAEG
jgi:phosphate transport system protein